MQESPYESLFDNPMGSADNISMKKICRVCLSQFDFGIPLFEPNESLNNTTAASLIWSCFGIKIQKQDKFPNEICNECSANILISHNFKIQLQQSHKLLQSRFAKEPADIVEGFRVIKLENNLYRIKINNVTGTDECEAETTNDYDDVLHNLRLNNQLELGSEDTLLVVTDDSKSVSLGLKSYKPDDSGSLYEARQWLKIARRTGPPYVCKVCNHTYNNSKFVNFYMHVRLHFTKKVKCPLCPYKYFPYRKKYHMLTHTKEKPHQCPNCSRGFTMRNHLNRHLKWNCIKNETTCTICQQTFATNKSLHVHMLRKHDTCRHENIRSDCNKCKQQDESKRMCEYCGLQVTRYSRHLNTCKSAPIDLKFQLQNATTCEKCGELLLSKYQIKCHMKKHDSRAKFSCEMCGKEFLRKEYLKDHLEIHAPGHYPCEECHKVFKRRLLLKRHKSIHRMGRKFVCPICSNSFKLNDHLKKHLVTHIKDRPYVCEVCNKGFKLKGNLNKHLAVHADVKPFACSVCKKTFTFKANFNRHMLVHDTSVHVNNDDVHKDAEEAIKESSSLLATN